jgi:hypothetical protein
LIIHTWSVSPLAIAGVRHFSDSCFLAKLYHATNKACIAPVVLEALAVGGFSGESGAIESHHLNYQCQNFARQKWGSSDAREIKREAQQELGTAVRNYLFAKPNNP